MRSGIFEIFVYLECDKYILFDGLTYDTRGCFASCVVFFRAPQGRRKIRAMTKISVSIIVKPSNKRFIIPRQKRCYFASILFGKSVLKKMHHLSLRARSKENTKS